MSLLRKARLRRFLTQRRHSAATRFGSTYGHEEVCSPDDHLTDFPPNGEQARATASTGRRPDRGVPPPNWRLVDFGPVRGVDRRADRDRHTELEHAAPPRCTELAGTPGRGSAAQRHPTGGVIQVAPRRVPGRDRRRLSPPRRSPPEDAPLADRCPAWQRLPDWPRCSAVRGLDETTGADLGEKDGHSLGLRRRCRALLSKTPGTRRPDGRGTPADEGHGWSSSTTRKHTALVVRLRVAGQVLWAHVRLGPCARTVFGAGKPK
jgi:hypothetical protein